MGVVYNCQIVLSLVVLLSVGTTLGTEKTYTNEYAVYIPLGKEVADQLAERHGFRNLGQIGELQNHFHFEHSGISKRSTLPATDLHAKLAEEPGVEWIEQQHLKVRVKRDVDVDSFSDPLWDEQWYLNGDVDTSMNVDRAWELGYTGNGVVVSILDDGLEINHPDLVNNYDPRASFDVNDQDGNPTPRYDHFNTNQHGTRCAGEVAMEANNGVCGVGVAYNASIGGIRMLDGPITDRVEAISLSIKKWYIDIYSSSWGPEDNGATVEGPGSLAQAAFKVGIIQGRRGLGSIFVWASGNGGRKDSCSCDGYANSIYTITVSSVKENGKVPFYLEECSSIMASTYSSGSRKSKKIVTSDLNGGCSRHFSGTSASAPLAAGICALALEANPRLTWRDLQYIIAMTAKRENLDGSWEVNGAGYHVSHRYGFGLMDAEAMVLLAEDWETLPKQHSCPVNTRPGRKVFFGSTVLSLQVETDGCRSRPSHVQYLEHVQLNITLTAKSRGDISIVLVSPSGTRSTMLPHRVHDRRRGSFDGWTFMSTHFWGERPDGTWELEIHSTTSSPNHRGTLKSWSLVLWGTAITPVRSENTASINYHEIVKREEGGSDGDYFDSISSFEDVECHEQCVDGCTGPAANECFRCKNFVDRNTRDCVEKCPKGFYPPLQTNRRCRKCDPSCKTCRGHSPDQCTHCHKEFVLTDNSTCVSESGSPCQKGFYRDGTDVCRQCPPFCIHCQSADRCEECDDGTLLSNGACVYQCQTTEYVDFGDILSCQPCHESCLTCSGGGDTDCKVCKGSKFFTIEGKCEGTTCGDGYYLDDENENCAECLYACSECTNDYTCDICDEGWLVSSSGSLNSCVLFCDEGTYSDGTHCLPCPGGCTICLLIVDDEEPICIDCDNEHKLENDQCVSCEGEECSSHCHPTCEECWGPGISQCFQCKSPSYLLDDTCVPFCPGNGFFPYVPDRTCDFCNETCSRCSGSADTDCTECHGDGEPDANGRCSTKDSGCDPGCSECFEGAPSICTACLADYVLQFSSCVENCQEGYYGEGRECLPCIATCRECTAYDQCTSCYDNYLFHDGSCTTSCGDGYHQEGKQCSPCSGNCRICAEDDDCHECDGGFYLQDGECVEDCKAGSTPVNEEDCWSCDPSCSECDGPNSGDCTKCKDGSEPDDHRCTNCTLGSYSAADGLCKTCNEKCLSCDGPTENECLSCDYYLFLSGQSCQTTCPDGSYEDFERNICVKCHKSCKTCIDSGPKNCIDCNDDYYLLLTNEQTCVLNCPEGHYPADDEGFPDCRICSHNCKGCSGSYLQCTSCKEGLYLYEDRCIKECPKNFDADDDRQRCVTLECPEHCVEGACNEWGDCRDCKEDYEEFFGECVESTVPCNDDQYILYDDNFEQVCAPCNSSCKSCVGAGPQNCKECASGKVLAPDGSCRDDCGDGSWHDENRGLCLACHPSCSTCVGISPRDCLSCSNYLQLYTDPATQSPSGPCVSGCPPDTYPQQGGDCAGCHESCGLCDGPGNTNCTSCKDGLYLHEGGCKAVCPSEGYYHWHPAGGRDGFECKPCHRSCSSCFDDDESSCTSCSDGTFRQQHSCQSFCDVGYYGDENSVCQPCPKQCDNCEESNKCTACKGEKVLYEGECHSKCPVHYYSDVMYSKHKVCQPCHQDCFTCSGSTVFECTSCYENYELDDNICFSQCPQGQYYVANATSESCLECHDSCHECFGPMADQCIGCISGEVLQRIDTNHARCTICCEGDKTDDCCKCSDLHGKDICPGYKLPQHRRRQPPPSPVGPVVFFCMLVVISFLVIFGLLQARSNRQLCWRDAYSRLPTYYDGGNQFVKIQTDPELDLDEGDEEGGGNDYFSEDDVYGEMTDEDEEEDY